jgi:4-hydroxy-2-oxoglutarate aldolase
VLSLRGILPPIPTPFKLDESIDFEHLRSNLERWNEWPLVGYVVGGSNGEAVALSAEERIELVAVARESIPERKLLLAGAGLESTRGTTSLAQKMSAVGADAVIVVTPSYYGPRLDQAAFVAHYTRVADESPLPVVLYNVPPYTDLDLPVPAVAQLAAHPNVIGIKESGGSVAKIAAMVDQTQDDFQVLAGSAGFLLGALAVGAVGCVPATGCIAARSIHELIEAFDRGDLAAARDLQAGLIEPNIAVTSRFGVAGLKAAMDLIGLYGGPVRSPLQPLSAEESAQLEQVLRQASIS